MLSIIEVVLRARGGKIDLLATSVNSFKQLKFLQTKPTAEKPYLKPRVSEKLYTLKENATLNIC